MFASIDQTPLSFYTTHYLEQRELTSTLAGDGDVAFFNMQSDYPFRILYGSIRLALVRHVVASLALSVSVMLYLP